MSLFTNHRLLILAVIVLAVLNIGTLASLWLSPQGKHNRPTKRTPRRVERFLEDQLNLSQMQREQFKDLREYHFDSVGGIHLELQHRRNLLFDKLSQPDSEYVSQMAHSIGQQHADLELANFRHFQDLRNRLNDQQKPAFDQMVKRMLDRGNHPPRNRRPEAGPKGGHHPRQ